MKMKLNNCKLKKNTQLRLLEYFVLEVTARSAANLLDIHPNTASLLYKKIRQIIGYIPVIIQLSKGSLCIGHPTYLQHYRKCSPHP
jgi:hypothetical protein